MAEVVESPRDTASVSTCGAVRPSFPRFPLFSPFFPFPSSLLAFSMLISPLLPLSLPTLATDGADGQRTRAPKSKNGNKMVVRERPRGKDGKR
jgi:hypothetical protein